MKNTSVNKVPFSVSLIVPVFNGRNTIIKQLMICKKILKSTCVKYEVIVSDDHSTDNTVILLKKYFGKDHLFRLQFNKENLGISKNTRCLYRNAKYDYILLYSADGDWNPYDIRKLILHAHSSKADVVIGKRNKKSYSLYRKTVSFFYNFLPIILFNSNVIDAASIKIVKKNLFNEISLRSESIFFEAELIIKAKKKGYIVSSIPIQFRRRNKKPQKGGKIMLILESFRDLLLLKLHGI